MFRPSADAFALNDEIKKELHSHDAAPHSPSQSWSVGASDKGKWLLERAQKYGKLRAEGFQNFDPHAPKIVDRHNYDVELGEWSVEEVMVEIDKVPFGRGAIRECFRMKEVALDTEPSPPHHPSGGDCSQEHPPQQDEDDDEGESAESRSPVHGDSSHRVALATEPSPPHHPSGGDCSQELSGFHPPPRQDSSSSTKRRTSQCILPKEEDEDDDEGKSPESHAPLHADSSHQVALATEPSPPHHPSGGDCSQELSGFPPPPRQDDDKGESPESCSPVHADSSHRVDGEDKGTDSSLGTTTFHLVDVAGGLLKIWRPDKRRLWVAKRAIKAYDDLPAHLETCKQDVMLQMVAKHYGELFNKAVRKAATKRNVKRPNGMRDVDFLMAHVIQFRDGMSFGCESFVSGPYTKHNNNSGATLSGRNTPQAFSFFTYKKSGHRLMIVDIQGVDDLYTDPVVHFLPAHCPGLIDSNVNLGLRGFALFLWSHRSNPIDDFLEMPKFEHAASEKLPLDAVHRNQKLHELNQSLQDRATAHNPTACAATVLFKQVGVAKEKILLADVPDVDWRLEAWAADRLPAVKESHPSTWTALPLDLVEAACHFEIAEMYHEGRICKDTLNGDLGAGGQLSRDDLEAAVFHLAEAARQGLLEALLALARLASDLAHEDFLPGVVSSKETQPLCLALLERAAERGSAAAHAMLGRYLMDGPPEDARKAARHLLAFAESPFVSSADDEEEEAEEEDQAEGEGTATSAKSQTKVVLKGGLDVPTRHGSTFGWEDSHGFRPHSAYAAVAELYEGPLRGDPGAWARSRELWQSAADAAMEDPRLAKQAMRYSQRAEQEEPEPDEATAAAEEAPAYQQLTIEVDAATASRFGAFASRFASPREALVELLRLAEATAPRIESPKVPAARDQAPAPVAPAAPTAYDDDVWGLLGGAEGGEGADGADDGNCDQASGCEAGKVTGAAQPQYDEDVWAMLGDDSAPADEGDM